MSSCCWKVIFISTVSVYLTEKPLNPRVLNIRTNHCPQNLKKLFKRHPSLLTSCSALLPPSTRPVFMYLPLSSSRSHGERISQELQLLGAQLLCRTDSAAGVTAEGIIRWMKMWISVYTFWLFSSGASFRAVCILNVHIWISLTSWTSWLSKIFGVCTTIVKCFWECKLPHLSLGVVLNWDLLLVLWYSPWINSRHTSDLTAFFLWFYKCFIWLCFYSLLFYNTFYFCICAVGFCDLQIAFNCFLLLAFGLSWNTL